MRSILVVVVLGILAAACSKEPAQTAPEATPPPAAAGQPPAPAPVDPAADAEQDAAKLAEYIDPRVECSHFKDRLTAVGGGSQVDDAMAKDFAAVMADAKAAGCAVSH